MKHKKTIKIAYTALCAAVFVICSWIALPSSPPFTLQTLAVLTAVGLFGVKISLAAYAVYLTLGALGLPVFAGWCGGFHVIVGPTGGFLLGFAVAIVISGIMIRVFGYGVISLSSSMFAGLAATYLIGTMFYAFVWLGEPTIASLKAALVQCVVPFILPDVLKIAASVYITKNLKGRTGL